MSAKDEELVIPTDLVTHYEKAQSHVEHAVWDAWTSEFVIELIERIARLTEDRKARPVFSGERMVASLNIAGNAVDLHFAMEICGAVQGRGPLYQFVCVACRTESPRGRNEWASKNTFLDDADEETRERLNAAMVEASEHARMHELIAAWAAKILQPGPTV